jgi:hypothetical protein
VYSPRGKVLEPDCEDSSVPVQTFTLYLMVASTVTFNVLNVTRFGVVVVVLLVVDDVLLVVLVVEDVLLVVVIVEDVLLLAVVLLEVLLVLLVVVLLVVLMVLLVLLVVEMVLLVVVLLVVLLVLLVVVMVLVVVPSWVVLPAYKLQYFESPVPPHTGVASSQLSPQFQSSTNLLGV